MSPATLSPTLPAAAIRLSPFLLPARTLGRLLPLAALWALVEGCGPATSHYALVEDSLRAGDAHRADLIVERAQNDYGTKNRVLYRMDRGMTMHLAGRYSDSNAVLEQAEEEVERLYTRRIRTEAKAFLINDTELPYEGEPYEQVMLNVLKSLNYAVMGAWEDALVEARRIDHRLNVLAGRVPAKDAYREDAFARYLTGVLYEATGDLNNAFIAYRAAHEVYRETVRWSATPMPPALRTDLLRVTDAVHLKEEHEQYLREFGEVAWQPASELQRFAHVVVISYNGRAPRKEDQFIDLPLSLDALRLVLLTKGAVGTSNQDSRAMESLLYGLSGHVVRVALPRLVPQKTRVAHEEVRLTGASGSFSGKTELAHNLTAMAEKSLADRYQSLAIKAAARAAVKFALAESAGRGAQAAAGKDAGPLVGLLIGSLAKALAVASEESDKRSWRMLPDEIQIARLWVPPGDYELRVRAVARDGGELGRVTVRTLTLRQGETRVVTERVLP